VPLPFSIDVPDVAGALPLNVFQSVELKNPFVEVSAWLIEITGVVVPVATDMGVVPVTLVTVPLPPPVAFSVPPANVKFVPTVTLLKPPEPLPYSIDVPDVAGA
jgi:hypothetical protein